MAIDIQKGREFVQTHGTPIERARLAALLDGLRPAAIPPELHALQNPDGGFPYMLIAGQPSTLNHTAKVLEWLADLGLDNDPVAGGAIAFLRARQTLGGIWREDRMLQHEDLPLWMDPDSTAADVYTTALCGAALFKDETAIIQIDRAVTWLQTQQGRDGLLPGFKLQASAMALPVFENLLGDASRHTRRLVAGLGRALTPDLDGGLLAELLFRLRQAGYGFHTEVVVRAWDLLQASQAPDGSFTSEEPEEAPIAATIRALDTAHSIQQSR
jgi:hypothetical protein